tara:strand:- start:614 stop:1234 length:621 start_codon:yes stop_codon:yes gene_type:complete
MIKKFYDNYVLPPLCDCCCSTKPVNYQRKKIVPNAYGNVLEVGIGSGLNFNYYNESKINQIVGLEPSEKLLEKAEKNTKNFNFDIKLIKGMAEDIQIESNSIDSVLLTYTLCTIADTEKALREIRRVLKSNGKIIFTEHGIAPDNNVKKWQNRINPVWKKLFGGCNLNKDIPKILLDAGFKIDYLEKMYLPSTPKIVGYNYWGQAH